MKRVSNAPPEARALAAKTLRDVRSRRTWFVIGGDQGRLTDYADARHCLLLNAPFKTSLEEMRTWVLAGNLMHLQHERVSGVKACGYKPSDTQWGAL